MSYYIAFLLPFFVVHLHEAAQTSEMPSEELRGVYLATSNSLDWPKSTDRVEQQASLRKILRDMKAANLNALFFQVRPRGDAYYKSKYEPWAEHLTGTLGQDPGWDPLAFVLDEAHKLGIEVHAWINVFKIRGQMPVPKQAAGSQQHPTLAYPEWTFYYNKEAWLNPGLPNARAYVLRVLMDLVQHYPIDGVCFDFIRYPGNDIPDKDAYSAYGKGKPIADWRRENINSFVREAHKEIVRVKPRLKVGAAPVGNFKGKLSGSSAGNTVGGAFDWYYQDAPTWLQKGWLDYLAPQVYWALANSAPKPDFAYIARSWQERAVSRHIYISIAAYRAEGSAQIPEKIKVARKVGAQGQIFFRYENVAGMNVFGHSYAEPATIPSMPWKK